MGYNYYNSNGKKTCYSSTDIFGNKCYRGTDGKVKGYQSTDLFGNKCYRGTDGKVKSYQGTDWLGNKCNQNNILIRRLLFLFLTQFRGFVLQCLLLKVLCRIAAEPVSQAVS